MDSQFNDPTQREIWATIRALNDAWTQGQPAQLSRYFHPQMVAITATDRRRRIGAAACIAGWTAFAEAARLAEWRELEPLIQVYGDSAVVSYYYELACTINGQEIRLDGRDMFFLVRDNGRWWVVADQFSGYPG